MAVYCLRTARRQRKRRRMLLLAAAMIVYQQQQKHQAPRTPRTVWQREWLGRMEELGAYDTLLSELRSEDTGSFLNFLRVSPGLFDELVDKVKPYIQRQDTTYRKAISPGMRLAITLRYLATGETFKSLGYLFRVGNNTVGTIIPETCQALHKVLASDYLKCPRTAQEWKTISRGYWEQWNYPNCLGSLDGKHVVIRQPACSGAKFFNYKHSFSIILLALVDSNYKFIFCDIGAQGRCSDGGMFAESDLHHAIEKNTLGIPEPEPLPGTDEIFPYTIIADDAFPLKENLMKPYPHRNMNPDERIFNYRISRARRCVENAFGIMSNRFRVLLNPICVKPSTVDHIILACVTLHNMLRTLSPNQYVLRNEIDSDPKTGMATTGGTQLPPAKVSSRRSSTKHAKQNRDRLCGYFNSEEGSVSWQQSMI